MDPEQQRYLSGEEIHAGDRVRFAGLLGIVVFVNDTREYTPSFDEGWSYLGSGFMVKQDGFGLIFLEKADEDLDFVARA